VPVAAPVLQVAPHAIVRDPLPLETRNELARERVQILEHVRERRAMNE